MGLLSAVTDFAAKAGARLAWIPRRAGERGAIEAGCLPSLLPGRPCGRTRPPPASTWRRLGLGGTLPSAPGLDGTQILQAAAAGTLQALVVAGLQPTDFADAQATRDGIEQAGFVVSLESRQSEVTQRADVVFPVDLIEEQAGTFWNWEHRPGRVNRVIKPPGGLPDDRRAGPRHALADALGSRPGHPHSPKAAPAPSSTSWVPGRAPALPQPTVPVAAAQLHATSGPSLVLASWRQLMDGSAAATTAPLDLLATAKPDVARLSAGDGRGPGCHRRRPHHNLRARRER